MGSIVNSLKKSFARLPEEERIETILEIFEAHNLDLRNNKVLRFQALQRWSTPIRYSGECRCGHSSYRHYFINGNFRDCKILSCHCDGFYEG